MNPYYCNLKFLYRGYEAVDDMLLQLEACANKDIDLSSQLHSKKTLNPEFKKWYNNLSRQSFDEQVFNTRNTIQVWMDMVKASNELTGIDRWYWSIIDKTKAFFRGKLKERNSFICIASTMFTNVFDRLMALDGGLENNEAYIKETVPAKDKLVKNKIGYTF